MGRKFRFAGDTSTTRNLGRPPTVDKCVDVGSFIRSGWRDKWTAAADSGIKRGL